MMDTPSKIDMGWEWNWPHMMKGDWSTTFFEAHFYHQKRGDHSPGWHFSLTIWNCVLLDFGYYNSHHVED